ncbi:STAS domain-containing protein [Sphaerisporangium sp. TRM90804]|uniref:STAS domain-containing protein n=1 Tax=Sphaerisporangium sp. TRM90804 TaxID=3031113 RepID=UPI002449BCAD|nr:STAS domain-containing protein [Sphaerisporangium sp. TRM90804]MDH2428468.1 STAS domain-containing protein [Sphaerisporangium sp. TRM90804]
MTVPDRADEVLTLTSRVEEGVPVVWVSGILDATTRQQFTDRLAEIADEHGADLVLDLAGVTFMDSRALGLIVHHWQRTMASDGHFALVGVKYSNSRVMWVTGLAQRLPLYDTLEEALASFKA